MGYYPIALDVTGRPCLVIGGGEVALRKAQALTEAGARVTVISPEIDGRIEDCAGVEIIRHMKALLSTLLELDQVTKKNGLLENDFQP